MATSGIETVFNLAGFRVTSTFLATLLVDAVIILLIIVVRRRLSLVPGGLQASLEGVVDFLQSTTEQVAGARATFIFPWVGVFFIFIVLSNLLGLLPGFGSLRIYRGSESVPLFAAGTSDLNLTLALAVVSVLATNMIAIRHTGLGTYLKRFFALNPILLFVGLLEILQEVTKFITFSFRLYGNISAGEKVLGTMSHLAAYLVPVPFLALETLVAVIQALVFALLTMAFMTIMTESHSQEATHA